ncbi:MAG: acyltransferase, partial [Parabacteroides sp.]|nr:acyltransferase [Parabacteroides sp.]
MTKTNKNLHIETLRGIAILLVVIGHVIGSTPEGGMRIDFPSPWRYLYLWIDYIQMPLFTAIAGWVYALKPIEASFSGKFMTRKACRLLVPMAVAATLYFLIQYITPGTNQKGNLEDIWKIYVFPYTIYWYLPSLFLMFAAIHMIDTNRWMDKLSGWATCLVCAFAGLVAQKVSLSDGQVPNLFSFMGAMAQFPYFVAGVGINRFSKQIITRKIKITLSLLAIVGVLSLQLEWFYPAVSKDILYSLTRPLWVIATLALLLNQSYSSRLFTWIGSYAYIIYLYHGFGTSGSRIILNRLGVSSEILI